MSHTACTEIKESFAGHSLVISDHSDRHDAGRKHIARDAFPQRKPRRLRELRVPCAKTAADAGKSLDKKMTEVEEALIQTKAKSGQDVLNFPIRVNNHLAALAGVVASADSAPTKQSYEVFDMLSKTVDEQLAKWQSVVTTDVKSYNDLIKQQDVPALLVKPPSEGK